MNFGDSGKKMMGECDKETSFEILDTFVSLGGNFIDTANVYQNEESEKWLGEWMTARDNRDQMVIATKYTSAWKSYHGDKLIQSNFAGNNMKSLRVSVEDSLKKLQTEYIDLLYVHWWDYTTSVSELMQGLNDLVTSGKVLYLGISDTPAWIVSKANEYARCHGMRQFSVYQGLWNASVRDMEREIVPMCRQEGMAIAPWGPLGQGRFQTEAVFAEREKNNPGRQSKEVTELDKKVSKVLEKIATSKNTSIHSVALVYILYKAPYVFPIVGGRTVGHLKGNVEALKLELSNEDIKEIDNAYGFQFGFPHGFLFAFDNPGSNGATSAKDVWLTKISGHFDWVEDAKAIKPSSS